jgi:hypothetical protein
MSVIKELTALFLHAICLGRWSSSPSKARLSRMFIFHAYWSAAGLLFVFAHGSGRFGLDRP